MRKNIHSAARIRACLRIISRAQGDAARPQYRGAWIDGPRGAVLTDGFILVRLNADAPELPHVEPGRGQLDAGRVMSSAAAGADKHGWEPLELPRADELKTWIKDRGGRRARPAYVLGDGAALVNAGYLLDVLEIMGPQARAAVPAGPFSPVLIWADVESPAGADAILLPIRPDVSRHGDQARAVIDYWGRR